MFNLVYETNVASCRIWDALGFKRIGRIKGCGNLKSYPDQLVDAIIYGRDLGPEGEDFVSEERFDKIKFYLKHGKYPNGADRAEKSRLRSAATHYKLFEDDRLMLKDKEVIPDAQKQYEIARAVHVQHHGGINKTTATIAEKYHWVRIKETVSLVIRNCTECKELAKAPVVKADDSDMMSMSMMNKKVNGSVVNVSAAGRVLTLPTSMSISLNGSRERQQQEDELVMMDVVDVDVNIEDHQHDNQTSQEEVHEVIQRQPEASMMHEATVIQSEGLQSEGLQSEGLPSEGVEGVPQEVDDDVPTVVPAQEWQNVLQMWFNGAEWTSIS